MKTVTAVNDAKRILQPANTNRKLGNGKLRITKGKWKGMPLYQLVLEERKTCPTTCQQWSNCYGNNMYLAKRIDHTDSSFLSSLWTELSTLAAANPAGFVVRLHVLGDFYSVSYVNFWAKALKKFTNLRVFGYTHRLPTTSIGKAVSKLNAAGAWVRFSDTGGEMSANVNGEGIQCPQETGKTESCLTCGLCWATTKAIAFRPH